ncbi:MAG: hypothetical protein J7K30_10675 [Deltaproteobacteria bacterium]|nr:hypothetical protein [Desulfosarcina sp. BuS5]MCD6273280.1 hypothetical protein [Deltaproteobacteria bacterium]
MPCLYGVATVTIDSHITGVAGVTVLFSTVNRERLRYFLMKNIKLLYLLT